jgi:hypothetical protein
MKLIDQLSNHLQQLSIQQTTTSQTTGSTVSPTQNLDVHSVQSTNLKATQWPDEKKKHRNKGKGDKKPTNNFGGGKGDNKPTNNVGGGNT